MYNITPAGLRRLFWALFITVSVVAIFSSCGPEKTYFTLTDEGHYDWTSGPSVQNQEQMLAYQHQGSFMLAKNSVQNGLQPLKKAVAVGQTQFTNIAGQTVACLAYKSGKNYDAPWDIVTYKGDTVATGVAVLPTKIIEEAGTLKFLK